MKAFNLRAAVLPFCERAYLSDVAEDVFPWQRRGCGMLDDDSHARGKFSFTYNQSIIAN